MLKNCFVFLISHLCIFSAFSAESSKPKSSKYESNQFIDVGSPNAKQIRVAVTDFEIVNAENKSPVVSATNRFKEILEFTNWFYLIPNSTFPDQKKNTNFNVNTWQMLKAEFVVLGKLKSSHNGRYTLELSVVDVPKNTVVAKRTYPNVYLTTEEKTKNVEVSQRINYVLRDFGDVAVNAITGRPGPFMTRLTFVGRKSKSASISNIYIADFDGKHAFPITRSNTINLSPSWSPDGKKILFTSYKTKKAEIFEYNLDTKKTSQITNLNANSSGAVRNAAGDLIAFSSSTPSGQTHLYTVTGPGAPKEPLVTSSRIAVEPAFSPDGTKLAYTSNRYSKPMIFVIDFATDKTTRITYAGWYNASATWNPINEQLAFASFDRKINRWDLFRIKPDGTDLTRITLKQGDNEKPTWSPDGRFIMFQSNRGTGKSEDTVIGNTYKLYLIDEDGESQKQINTSVPDSRQPAWGPRLTLAQLMTGS